MVTQDHQSLADLKQRVELKMSSNFVPVPCSELLSGRECKTEVELKKYNSSQSEAVLVDLGPNVSLDSDWQSRSPAGA